MNLPARARLFLLVCVVLSALASPAWAEMPAGLMEAFQDARQRAGTGSRSTTITEQAKLLDPSGEAVYFGSSVAISGDTAVVGAPNELNPDGFRTGAAYVFVRNGSSWSEQARLLASDWFQRMTFGGSVAISGDTVLVGATTDPTPALPASVYVFVRSGSSWSEQAKLTTFAGGQTWRGFGNSVAMDGDTAVVGSWNESINDDSHEGAAYVFVRSGSSWSEQARLSASDGEPYNFFGMSVAISGDSVAVGAEGRNESTGAAYVFTRSGSAWFEQGKLLASDGEPRDLLGRSIAMSGDTVVVGAPLADNPAIENAGAAYVFERSGSSWSQQTKLLASDGMPDGFFGYSVALSGDTLVVSEPAKAAHVFRRVGAGWYERARLLSSDLGELSGADFGSSVALSGESVVVGATHVVSQAELYEEAAYVFSLAFAPGVTVIPVTGLVTTEWSGTATFSVALDTQPTGSVVIDLASSDPGEGSISASRLTFTTGDWSTPRTVTLMGVDDFVKDGNQPYTAIVSINRDLTADPIYDGIDPPDVAAVNLGLEGDFYTITPCRVLDTRELGQGGLGSGEKLLVTFHGICEIPTTAGAVAINVTAVQPTGRGTLKLSPGDLAPAALDTLTFAAQQTRCSNAIVPLSIDGTGMLAVWPLLFGGGLTDVVIDVSGYFE